MARDELPFLFKAFELGQVPPPRPGTKRAEAPRAATIHEYLDWTVTASEPEDPDELVSGGGGGGGGGFSLFLFLCLCLCLAQY